MATAFREVDFFAACRGNEVALVEEHLRHGATPDDRDKHGVPALVHAVVGNALEVLFLLIERGANVSASERASGWTALHHALYSGHVQAALALLAGGAPLEGGHRDADRLTALDLLCCKLRTGARGRTGLGRRGGVVLAAGKCDDQLGFTTGAKKVQPAFRRVRGAGEDVVAVSCGALHTLALSASGSVLAWGRNSHGELGLVSRDAAIEPAQATTGALATAGRIVAVGAGEGHSVALSSSGRVVVWGRRLGVEETSARPPRLVGGMGHRRCACVAAGTSHAVVATEDGCVFGWGDNRAMQVAGEQGAAWVAAPVEVTALRGRGHGAAKLAAGATATVALFRTGAVVHWGHSRAGLRTPSIKESTPFSVGGWAMRRAGTAAVVDVACGDGHFAAVDAMGDVFTWGTPGAAPETLGETTDSGGEVLDPAVPRRVGAIGVRCTAVAAGPAFTVVATERGDLYGWGLAPRGGLGAAGERVPTPVRLSGACGVASVAVGQNHVTAVACTQLPTLPSLAPPAQAWEEGLPLPPSPAEEGSDSQSGDGTEGPRWNALRTREEEEVAAGPVRGGPAVEGDSGASSEDEDEDEEGDDALLSAGGAGARFVAAAAALEAGIDVGAVSDEEGSDGDNGTAGAVSASLQERCAARAVAEAVSLESAPALLQYADAHNSRGLAAYARSLCWLNLDVLLLREVQGTRSATPHARASDFLAASPLLDSSTAPFPSQAAGQQPQRATPQRTAPPGTPGQAFVPALDLDGERRERAARFYERVRAHASSGGSQQRSPVPTSAPSRRRGRRRSSSYSQSAEGGSSGSWARHRKGSGPGSGARASEQASPAPAAEGEARSAASPPPTAKGARRPRSGSQAQAQQEESAEHRATAPATGDASSAWPSLSAATAPSPSAAASGSKGAARAAEPAAAATPRRRTLSLKWAEESTPPPRGREEGGVSAAEETPSLRRMLSEESGPQSGGRGRGGGPHRGMRRRAKGKGRAVDLGAFLQGPAGADPKPVWGGGATPPQRGAQAETGASSPADAAPSLSAVLAEHEAERARRDAFHRSLNQAAPHARRVEADGHQKGGWGMVPDGPQRTLADIMGAQAVDEEQQRLAEAEEDAMQQAIRASLAEADGGGGDARAQSQSQRGGRAQRGGKHQARGAGRGRRGGRGGGARGRGGSQPSRGRSGGAAGARGEGRGRGGTQCRRGATSLSAGASTFVPGRK